MSNIPHDATIEINVHSLTNALRGLAVLLPYNPTQAINNLNSLAERVEDMYYKQNPQNN